METLHVVPFLVTITLWTGIALVLVIGLFGLIFEVLVASGTDKDNLFNVFRIAGLTTVLGAVIALPLTVIRLRLTQEQTTLAQKQTDIARESLFNEKINAATQGLYARRQVTEWHRQKGYVDHWQDDIVQRCAAIDRLEGLARENNAETPRIARLLSVYVCELSSDVQPHAPPSDATSKELRNWARQLPKPRSDMEKAAQTLGRLHKFALSPLDNGEIDLRGANLQKCNLKELAFDEALFIGAQLQGAELWGAKLRGANLSHAKLQGADLWQAKLHRAELWDAKLQGADFSGAELQRAILIRAELQRAELYDAKLQGANLSHAKLQGVNLNAAKLDGKIPLIGTVLHGAAVKEVDFTKAPQITKHLNDVFGDGTTTLPTGVERPDHWTTENLKYPEFLTQWRVWQATLEEGWDE
ncbi:pentapeptide repeat-containing protein [Tateyamaria sp.]|uniref:pentapeptide repeat-containing protein n=1 Tax=Tateyamaria sp. TaxID=1929288 RepID=UPI0032A06797